jgi:predicted nucleotide-binding protein
MPLNPAAVQAFDAMSQLIQAAELSLVYQDDQAAASAALSAQAIDTASRAQISFDDSLIVGVMKDLVCLYASLTQAAVFQIQGQFVRALGEIANGLAMAREGSTAIQAYAQLPNANPQTIQQYQPVLSILAIMLMGSDASVRADIVGYQGNIPQYRTLLQEAAGKFGQAANLPPSLDPMFLALSRTCKNLASRLLTRVQFFPLLQRPRYLIPTGDKIFVIHGHDEAKRREICDLLQARLGLRTLVLQGLTGIGLTLIEKFEQFADDCCYAFALFTPDDFVKKKGESHFQARPNVLFEVGWFYGHLGRDHVCILLKGKTELPSDLGGIVTIKFQDNVSEVFVQIEDELKRARVIQ